MHNQEGVAYVDEDDQCFNCRYYLNEKPCPLMLAISFGKVEICGDGFLIKNCEWFEKAGLRIVK